MPDESFILLKRDMPWERQIGHSLFIGLALGPMGTLLLSKALAHWGDWEQNLLPVIVGGAFALVGALMLLLAIHQYFASQVPETEVAIEPSPLRPGSIVRLRLRQAGPIALSSLSGRLICETRRRRAPRDNASVGQSRNDTPSVDYIVKHPYQNRIFKLDAENMESPISAHNPIERIFSFTIPSEGLPSQASMDFRVTWRIEVWGRVRLRPDFMHPFTIEVTNSNRR